MRSPNPQQMRDDGPSVIEETAAQMHDVLVQQHERERSPGVAKVYLHGLSTVVCVAGARGQISVVKAQGEEPMKRLHWARHKFNYCQPLHEPWSVQPCQMKRQAEEEGGGWGIGGEWCDSGARDVGNAIVKPVSTDLCCAAVTGHAETARPGGGGGGDEWWAA